jgi:putrescine importer
MTSWCMAMDYIPNPLICTIWSSKATMNFVPEVPYVAWVLLFAALFTALSLRGVETSARINAAGVGIVIALFVVAKVYLSSARVLVRILSRSYYNRSTFSAPAVFPGPRLRCSPISAVTAYRP